MINSNFLACKYFGCICLWLVSSILFVFINPAIAESNINYDKQQNNNTDIKESTKELLSKLQRTPKLTATQKKPLNLPEVTLNSEWDALHDELFDLSSKIDVSAENLSDEEIQLTIKGIELAKKALSIAHNEGGEQHLATATGYDSLSFLIAITGDFDTSISYTKKAIEIYTKLLGKDSYVVGVNYVWLSKQYHINENYQDSVHSGMKGFTIQNQYYLYEDESLFEALDIVTRSLEKMDASQAGTRLYEILIRYHGHKYAKDDPLYTKWVNNLADSYRHDGKYDEAITMHKQNLQIREEILGDNHCETLTTVSNLGMAYSDSGQYSKAIPLFERAVAVNMEVAHEFDFQVINNQLNLGYTYLRMKDYDKAKAYFLTIKTNTKKILDSVEVSKQRHILPDWVSLYNAISETMLMEIKGK